jgi:hypothetical protein
MVTGAEPSVEALTQFPVMRPRRAVQLKSLNEPAAEEDGASRLQFFSSDLLSKRRLHK